MHMIFISYIFTAKAPNISANNKPSNATRILAGLNTQPFYVNLLLSNESFLQQELELWSALCGCKSGNILSEVAKKQFKNFIGSYINALTDFDDSHREKLDFELKADDEIEEHYEKIFLNRENPSTTSIFSKFIYNNLVEKKKYINYDQANKNKTIQKINALKKCFE